MIGCAVPTWCSFLNSDLNDLREFAADQRLSSSPATDVAKELPVRTISAGSSSGGVISHTKQFSLS